LIEDLEGGRVVLVADKAIGEAEGEGVEGSGDRHADRLKAVATEILHRRVEAWRCDLQRGAHGGSSSGRAGGPPFVIAACSASNSLLPTASKRTASPGANKAGRGQARSKRRIGVVPMRCQPPGLSSG